MIWLANKSKVYENVTHQKELGKADFAIYRIYDDNGEPVMNAKGELIGLAFDGNKESLASNYESVPGL